MSRFFRPVTRVSFDGSRVEIDPHAPMVLGPFGLGYSKPSHKFRMQAFCFSVPHEDPSDACRSTHHMTHRMEIRYYFMLGIWTRKQRRVRIDWNWRRWYIGVDWRGFYEMDMHGISVACGPWEIMYAWSRRV